VVPFRLSNAAVVFMCLMNGVFRDYLDKFVIVFLDDILVYSKSEEEHEQHLMMVLQVLREHHLYDKLSKCSFYQKKIHYLGHIISRDGIVVDPKNIEAIREWFSTKECERSQILYGSSWILQKVHFRALKDSLTHHFLAKEGEQVSMD
jgi:hypothetical protein